jgi:hypothetical protein
MGKEIPFISLVGYDVSLFGLVRIEVKKKTEITVLEESIS